MWPFRTGNDDRFQQTAASSPSSQRRTIYDDLGGEIPVNNYLTEASNYSRWRRKRGIIQSVIPTAFYGCVAGFFIGWLQSPRDARSSVTRVQLIGRTTVAVGVWGLITASIHHMLIMRCNYEESAWQPILAGFSGGTAFMTLSRFANFGTSLFVGGALSCVYATAALVTRTVKMHLLQNWLAEQQRMEVPVHRVSPELQPLYRAFLWDHRPLEERSEQQRAALAAMTASTLPGGGGGVSTDAASNTLHRLVNDARLDARSLLSNLTPEIYHWVNFPPWWPMKVMLVDASDGATAVMLRRQRDEEQQRLAKELLSNPLSFMHGTRFASGRKHDEI